MKLALTVALSAAMVSCAPPASATPPYQIDLYTVVPIICGEGYGGTAFRIGPTRYISAQHVTTHGPCRSPSGPLVTVREDATNDIAELSGPAGPHLSFSCRGYQDRGVYLSLGFVYDRARGIGMVALPQIATVISTLGPDPMTMLVGQIIPGMSGGPIVDRSGTVVGINNRHTPASSRPLRGTFVCPQR